jgi:hypothetical protein
MQRIWIWDGSLGIVTGYWLDCRGSIPAGTIDFSLLQSVQTGSGAHVASYALGTGGFIPGK